MRDRSSTTRLNILLYLFAFAFIIVSSACMSGGSTTANTVSSAQAGPNAPAPLEASTSTDTSTDASTDASTDTSADASADVSTAPSTGPSTTAGEVPASATGQYKLTYQIDRSNVPPIYYRELTLKVTVNQMTDATVIADGIEIPYTYDAGVLVLTTNATTIEITLSGVTDTEGLGYAEKAILKDDKGFAWSHGMDDNVYVKSQVDILEQYGWRGTIFLIANVVEDERDEDWIVDAPYLKEKIALGWSIGNHSYDHNCDPTTVTEQTVLDGYNRLREIVDTSPVPEYQIISFASPCFLSEYQAITLNHRDNGVTAVQFNESGGPLPLVVDPGVTENVMDPNDSEKFLAAPFSYDAPVGRSILIEYEDLALEMATLDLMANLYTEQGLHSWHNTLAHGDMETGPDSHSDRLATVAEYVSTNYGPGGTDQIWVAPSDQIYSYLLVRDNAVVSLVNVESVSQ